MFTVTRFIESSKEMLGDASGQAISEYALIAGCFALAAIAAFKLIGSESASQLSTAQNNLINVSVNQP